MALEDYLLWWLECCGFRCRDDLQVVVRSGVELLVLGDVEG